MELSEISRLASELAELEYKATHGGKERGFFIPPKLATARRDTFKKTRMCTAEKDELDAKFYHTSILAEQKLWEEQIAVGVKRQDFIIKNHEAHFRLKAQLKNRGKDLETILTPSINLV